MIIDERVTWAAEWEVSAFVVGCSESSGLVVVNEMSNMSYLKEPIY